MGIEAGHLPIGCGGWWFDSWLYADNSAHPHQKFKGLNFVFLFDFLSDKINYFLLIYYVQ